MAQPDPGKLRMRYPQNVGNPRQPRAPSGSQPQMMKQMPVQMPFTRSGTPMGHQQQFGGSPVGTHMFTGQMPQYAQPHFAQPSYYYTVPNQNAGHMYTPYPNTQYSGNMYGMPNTMGQVPASSAAQVPVQQMQAAWQQQHGGGSAATGGGQVLTHNPVVSQQQAGPAPPKQARSGIKITDPGTGNDVTMELLGSRTRSQSGNAVSKSENTETSAAASSEEKERQKKLEEKEKAIADFKKSITNVARKKEEEVDDKVIIENAVSDNAVPDNAVPDNAASDEMIPEVTAAPVDDTVKENIKPTTHAAPSTEKQAEDSIDNTVTSNVPQLSNGSSHEVTDNIAPSSTAEPQETLVANKEEVEVDANQQGTVSNADIPQISDVPAVAETDVSNESPEVQEPVNQPIPVAVQEDNECVVVHPPTSTTNDNGTAESCSDEAVPSQSDITTPAVEQEEEKVPEPVVADIQEAGVEQPIEEEIGSESAPFVQAPKKKKQKQRLKEMSAKGEREANGNMMDAFVDKPVEEASPPVEEQPKADSSIVPPPEDETWEEKEEFEVDQTHVKKKAPLLNQPQDNVDVESEEVDNGADDGADDGNQKRQYSRDFLLQFAKNCTSKPDGLPEMDIVLKKPHGLTEPLNQDQRQAYVDFAPQYCRQQSAGRHSGSGRQKGSRGGNFAPPPPKKVITVQAPVEVELRRTENKWVRPSEAKKDMDEKDLDKEEVGRKTRGILNKLTPQNFETLLDQMKKLKIDSLELMKEVIEIIFDKAISEPNFSVAYARMCHELSQAKVTVEANRNISFKTLLLNRCQQEFMKEREVEQQMQLDKDRKFETREEEEQWKETMQLKEYKARRSALGNVRFIGELYKLKMLREEIMHDCVTTLLKKNDEEYLEWVSKLLTTVGKSLSKEGSGKSKDGEDKMNHYFARISACSVSSSISSRVRFMLQDLIELRENGWVPRREDNNPKTIDQLREERKNQTKQQEIAAKLQERPSNRSRGGRDSPAMKGGGQVADGWTSVRKGKAPSTQLDANKFKAIRNQQLSNSEVSLGPSRAHQTWAKGSSGGSANAGNGAPPSETRGYNRYNVLNSYEGGGRDTSDSRDRQRQGQRMPDHEKERAAAIAASREIGRSSRSQSPAVKTAEERQKKPATPPVEEPLLSDEKIEKSVDATIAEYLCNNDIKEAIQCIVDLKVTSKHHVIMTKIIFDSVDRNTSDCARTGILVNALMNGTVSKEAFSKGLQALLSQSSGIIIDIPYLWNMLAALVAPVVVSNTVTLNEFRKIAEGSLDDKSALGLCMAEILAAVVKESSEKQALELWTDSGIKWDSLFKSKETVQGILKKLKLEFTVDMPAPFPYKLFDSDGNNASEILDWLKSAVPPKTVPSGDIMEGICTSVCKAAVASGNKFAKEPIQKYSTIMQDYITPYDHFRSKLLLIAQQIADSFDYPQGLLCGIFETLYDCDIVEEGTIYEWVDSSQVSNRKNIAVADVKPFLDWMRSAEDHQEKDSATK